MEDALASLPEELDVLQAVTALRRALGPELGRRAAELRSLRLRSRGRFPVGVLPYLTRRGLEQATPWIVARARAEEMRRRLGSSRIWDATCGVGADGLALARSGCSVLLSDRDPEVLACAAANLAASGAGGRVLRADACHPPFAGGSVRALLLDPDRRASGRRSGDPADWSPSLRETHALTARFPAACVELPPVVEPDRLPAGWRPVWTSLAGELREVTAWTGELARGRPPREALALDADGGRTSLGGEPVEVEALDAAAAARVAWLAEPDPAVIRAGLLGNLARETGLAPLAPRLAYLGGHARPVHGLLRRWRVLGTAPLDRRRVRSLLGEHDVGPLTVKKRGHPEPAEVLARRLAGPGSRPGLLAVARLERGHLALLLAPEEG